MKRAWLHLPEIVAAVSISVLLVYTIAPPRAGIALQAIARYVYWIWLELLPLSLLLPVLLLGYFNSIIGWTLTSLAGEDYRQSGPRQDFLEHTTAYAVTALTFVAFGALIASSMSFSRDSWVPLGGWAWVLAWAALFAPWYVLRHWTPHDSGRSSPVRACLLVMSFGFVAGWLYFLSPWLIRL